MAGARLFDRDPKMWRAVPHLLTEQSQHKEIAHCGYRSVSRNDLFNEPLMAGILKVALHMSGHKQ